MTSRAAEFQRKQKQRTYQAAGLAVAFVVVLWFQFGRSNKQPNATVLTPTQVSLNSPSQGSAQDDSSDTVVALPRLDINAIVAANPFTWPTPIRPPRQPSVNRKAPPRKNPEVAAVFKAGDQWAAIVNSRVVHAGERLPGGQLIVEINASGIRIASPTYPPK